MSTYREIGILITLASLLERGEIAKAEGKGALHLPKGTRGAITLVTMLAVFMLTVVPACLTLVTPVIARSYLTGFVPDGSSQSPRPDKVFTESGLPRENVFRILPERLRDYLFNSLRRF